MLSHPQPGQAVTAAGADSTPARVRTALVVDDSFAARRRMTTLLELGGWRVHQAVGTDAALRLADLLGPDLVVTDMPMRNGHGATLMRRLREDGCRARFLVTAEKRTSLVRSLAASAGAVACLAKPVDPRLLLDVLRGLVPEAPPAAESPAPRIAVAEAGRDSVADRTEEMYRSALPHRLASIATSAQEGNAPAVAAAAAALGTASERLGYPEIAFLCWAITADARRGVVAHTRLIALVSLCARVETGAPVAARQAATSR
jgi:CheY-like chemotaxis protein